MKRFWISMRVIGYFSRERDTDTEMVQAKPQGMRWATPKNQFRHMTNRANYPQIWGIIIFIFIDSEMRMRRRGRANGMRVCACGYRNNNYNNDSPCTWWPKLQLIQYNIFEFRVFWGFKKWYNCFFFGKIILFPNKKRKAKTKRKVIR